MIWKTLMKFYYLKKKILQLPKHGRHYWGKLRTYKQSFNVLKQKKLVNYYDLYFQSDTLLLVDIFQNFQNICLEIHELDLAHVLSAPGLAWQRVLKKKKVKVRYVIWYWFVVNNRKTYQRWNLSCYLLISKG